jgi:acyl-CoA dehydrogenase
MDFALSDEERAIRDTVRSFVRKELLPLEPEALRRERAGQVGVEPEHYRELRLKARSATTRPSSG